MSEKNPTVKNNTPPEPYRFKKRHGSTTFLVNVYFNPNAKETAKDKFIRIIRSEAAFGTSHAKTQGTSLGKVVNL